MFSHVNYALHVLDSCLGGEGWQEFFDFLICDARKPGFFSAPPQLRRYANYTHFGQCWFLAKFDGLLFRDFDFWHNIDFWQTNWTNVLHKHTTCISNFPLFTSVQPCCSFYLYNFSVFSLLLCRQRDQTLAKFLKCCRFIHTLEWNGACKIKHTHVGIERFVFFLHVLCLCNSNVGNLTCFVQFSFDMHFQLFVGYRYQPNSFFIERPIMFCLISPTYI